MKIAYIGNFEPRHSTETHVRLSLEHLGHEVIRIQENRTSPQQLEHVLFGADLVLYTRTWGLPGAEMLDLWRRLKERGIPTVSYHLDLYRGLARTDLYERLAPLGITSPADDPFWRTEYCFTVDGDPDSAEWFKSQGINHYWMRAGVYHAECYRVAVPERYPVLFCGSHGYHSEWPMRGQLIEFLGATYGRHFTLVPGNGNPAIRNHELNELYGASRVVVGDSLCPGFKHKAYSSDRAYETLGRGGFLIYPYIEDQFDDEFEDRKHIVFYEYGDFAGLKQLVDYYLEAHEEREWIRTQGHERVKERCTYVHRLDAILETVAANRG